MGCGLDKRKVLKKINYVGVSGNKYPILPPSFFPPFGYINHGFGGEYKFDGQPHEARGIYLDLPHNDYPYTIEYKEEYYWNCCKICNCKNKS